MNFGGNYKFNPISNLTKKEEFVKERIPKTTAKGDYKSFHSISWCP